MPVETLGVVCVCVCFFGVVLEYVISSYILNERVLLALCVSLIVNIAAFSLSYHPSFSFHPHFSQKVSDGVQWCPMVSAGVLR